MLAADVQDAVFLVEFKIQAKIRNLRMRIISAIMNFLCHHVISLYMFLLVLSGFRWFCNFFWLVSGRSAF